MTYTSLAALGLLALQLPATSSVQAAAVLEPLRLTGKVTRQASANTTGSSQQSYWFKSSNLTYTPSGKAYRQGAPMQLFCLDHDLTTPVTGVGRTSSSIKYEIFNPKIHTAAKSSVFESYSSPKKGLAIFNYVFDNYYNSYFAGQSAGKQRAWQMLLWEVAEDYNGTATSINAGGGVVTSQLYGFSGTNYATELFGKLKAALLANQIPDNYKSKNKFDINLLHVVDGSKTQDMVVYAIAPIPAALPLFGSAIVGFGALAMRRRRNAQADPAAA